MDTEDCVAEEAFLVVLKDNSNLRDGNLDHIQLSTVSENSLQQLENDNSLIDESGSTMVQVPKLRRSKTKITRSKSKMENSSEGEAVC